MVVRFLVFELSGADRAHLQVLVRDLKVKVFQRDVRSDLLYEVSGKNAEAFQKGIAPLDYWRGYNGFPDFTRREDYRDVTRLFLGS